MQTNFIYAFSPVASAPTGLTAVQEGPTGIRVSWTPPTPLGNTTGYRIYSSDGSSGYDDIDSSGYYSDGSSGSEDVTGGSTDNLLLTDLQSGATYDICIVGTSDHLPSDIVKYSNVFISLGKHIILSFHLFE